MSGLETRREGWSGNQVIPATSGHEPNPFKPHFHLVLQSYRAVELCRSSLALVSVEDIFVIAIHCVTEIVNKINRIMGL